jgi:hypothetical protein
MVSRIELTQAEIMGHEPCYYISEMNKQAHDSSGFRRFQTITVIRNDRKVKFERDIGDSRLFGEQFQLVCGVPNGKGGGEALYTVDEAIRMAETMNLMPPSLQNHKPKDYNKLFWDNVEEKQKWKRGVSVFGPKFKKERT